MSTMDYSTTSGYPLSPLSRSSASPTRGTSASSANRRNHSAQPHRTSAAGSSSSGGGAGGAGSSSSKQKSLASSVRPASASDAMRGGSSGARFSGGSPNLNAAAAALAERQTMAEMLAAMRTSQCRCRTDGGQPTGIGSGKKDVESLSEELRQARSALAASIDQNRILRTERQRLEDELNRCRAGLAKAEAALTGRDRSNGGKGGYRTGPAATNSSLVYKLREQLAAQQAQSETLKAQLDEMLRGTRATKMAELQAQVRAQDQELARQAEMHGIMRRRMEEAEARVDSAVSKGLEAERLARLQLPIARLQHAIEINEVKDNATAAILDLNAVTTPATAGAARPPGTPGHSAGGAGVGSSGGSSAGAGDGGSSALAKLSVGGAQSFSSGRIRKTMAALGEAHRAIFGQASLLAEVFSPGLTTEQLCVRAALRPATSGAPEVLRYLRHHVHRLVDVLSTLPGSRVAFLPEDEEAPGSTSGGGAGWSSPSARRGRNGRVAAVRTSAGGGGNMSRSAGGKDRSGGGGGIGGDDYDPWSFLGEFLDYVRWLRTLDPGSLALRPDLESGVDQVAGLVATCQEETRRLMPAFPREEQEQEEGAEAPAGERSTAEPAGRPAAEEAGKRDQKEEGQGGKDQSEEEYTEDEYADD